MNTRDGGFTLIELLVTVTILGVIMGALTTSIIVFLKNSDDTTTRFAESHDAQLASAYLADDVQSAVTTTVLGSNCSSTSRNSVGVVRRFEWDDPGDVTATTDDTVRIVFYTTQTVSDETRLIRNDCKSGDPSATGTVMAHFLDPAVPPAVTPPCASVCASASTVTMTVTEKSGYSYTLTGKKRRS